MQNILLDFTLFEIVVSSTLNKELRLIVYAAAWYVIEFFAHSVDVSICY